MNTEAKIKKTIERYSMLSTDTPLAVAFSGGADSVALLEYMNRHFKHVSAIHINHMIRETAKRDEDFCREFCRIRNIPFFCVHCNVPEETKKSGEGLEECARRLRYSAIEDLVLKEGIEKVATAHHANDNAETVIFNLVRGSGTSGACGIPPVRGIYVRPLITISKDEILKYCKENFLEFVTDETNFDTDYTRNYIRHEIYPHLCRINPSVTDALTRFCDTQRTERDYILSEAKKIRKNEKRNVLAEKHDALLSAYIRILAKQYGAEPNYKVTSEIIKCIRKNNDYLRINVGGGVSAVCDRDTFYFEKSENKTENKNFVLQYGKNDLDDFGCEIYISYDEKEIDKLINIYKLSIYTLLNFDKIIGILSVRKRCDGDSYRFGGMTRKLKKLFNSRGFTVRQRNSLPIICDDNGILWIPGFPEREGTKSLTENKKLFIGYRKKQ